MIIPEMRLERRFDATPELVFDVFLDPDAHAELFAPEGWRLLKSEMDVRVGGVWSMVTEDPDGERDRVTYVFTEIARPHRLAFTMSMVVGGRTLDSRVSITLEAQGGGTLFTLVQSGFETEEERGSFLSGAAGFLDSLQRVVAARAAKPGSPGGDPGTIARSIIDANRYMVLATADQTGLPWASPVYFAPSGYTEFFWVSSPEATHSRNIAVKPQVGIVIFDSRVPIGTGQGVYMSAVAEMMSHPELAGGIDLFSRRAVGDGGSAWTQDDVQEGAPIRLYRAIPSEFSILAKDGRPDHRIVADVLSDRPAT